eukprot:Amastigsp_a681439_9.p2 type:complete len:123 gc:universal Amastigsp_a681439_9:347-715(+)
MSPRRAWRRVRRHSRDCVLSAESHESDDVDKVPDQQRRVGRLDDVATGGYRVDCVLSEDLAELLVLGGLPAEISLRGMQRAQPPQLPTHRLHGLDLRGALFPHSAEPGRRASEGETRVELCR